jgi:hypothetical protein
MAFYGLFISNKRLERHLSCKLLNIFGCNSLNIDPKNILSHLNTTEEIKDGIQIQNGAKNIHFY